MFYLENAPSPGGSGMSPILFLVIGLIVGAIIMFIINLIRGASASKKSESIIEKAKKDGEICDAIISASSFFSEILKKYFWLNNKTKILEFGDPSNDIYFDGKKDEICDIIKSRYEIPQNQKIILYAPTFRDDLSIEAYNLDMPQIIESFEKRFHSECVLLLRFHPNITVDTTVVCNDKIKDVSDYDIFDELLIASDFLISDYSSVIVNAIYINKPVFIYAYDLEKYSRGFNDLYNELPCKKSFTNYELIENILEFDYDIYISNCNKFVKSTHSFNDGNAAQRAVKWLKDN